MVTTHTDQRRTLTAYPEGKIIEVHEDSVIGDHYHKLKTEVFFLVAGDAILVTKNIHTGEEQAVSMEYLVGYEVLPYNHHKFYIKEKSVLLGFCSNEFTPEDDYKL